VEVYWFGHIVLKSLAKSENMVVHGLDEKGFYLPTLPAMPKKTFGVHRDVQGDQRRYPRCARAAIAGEHYTDFV